MALLTGDRGNPLLMYHGTRHGFDEFDVGMAGLNCGDVPVHLPRQAGSGMVVWSMPLRARASRPVM